MNRVLILVMLMLLVACVPNKTARVSFDPTAVETMPQEVALDVIISFSKTTAQNSDAMCIFDEVGVRREDKAEVVPYDQICFYADNVPYSPVDWHSHIFLVNKASGTAICDSMIAQEYYGQKSFERKMKWLGEALLSLGAEYCPD